MRLLIFGLLGAFVGFLGMYAAINFDFTQGFPSIVFEVNIVLVAITVVLLIFTIISTVQMKKKATLILSGDEEDQRDVWQYKRFSDVSLCATTALVLSIVAVATSIITVQPTWLLLLSGIAVLASTFFSVTGSALIQTIYPERELPSPAEKNYAKKLLAASDEGEKFVMLQGLYKTFSTTNMLLIFSLFLLIIYSVGTGDSQLFSIFVIGLILIGANTQYLFTIRNK